MLSQYELSQLVETSEAEAYRSLIETGRADGVGDFRTCSVGSATVLVSPAAPNALIMNRVIGLGLETPADETQLDVISALYAPHRLPWGLELGSDAAPPELFDWLKKRRIRRTVATAMLYRSCDNIPPTTTSLAIRQWTPEDGNAGADLAAEIFRVPDPVRAVLARLPHHPGWRQWLALDGREVVATSLLYLGEGIAWSGWGATLPTYRGKGIHGALLAARLADARKHGCSWLTSETAVGSTDNPDPSYRNLTRLGFRVSHLRHTFVSMPRPQNR